MSQAMTTPEAIYGLAGFLDRTMQRVPTPGTGRAKRRETRAIARVPMLDWPADLFDDNATLPELVTVDFLLQCDPVGSIRASH
jgi:hypothetical protein